MADVTLSGRQLGDFRLLERIDEGGFGAVYRAEQQALERQAVVKVLHPGLACDPDLVQRFAREARLASRLDHPFAAHVYAFGCEPDGVVWIAMELVAGKTLTRYVADRGPLTLERFVPLLERLAQVVQAAHEDGIVHRDIKPDNVMVTERGGELFPKLLDFGAAKLRGERFGAPSATGPVIDLTPCDTVIGTAHYLAPEAWDGTSAGPAADIYALGILAYEALTGTKPYRGDRLEVIATQHCTGEIPRVGSGLPARLDRVFRRVLAKDPADRYASALDLAAALRSEADARLVAQIRTAARAWDDRGRPRGLLWRDDALAELQRWNDRTSGVGLTVHEVAFVDECRLQGEREAEALARKRQTAKRLGAWTAGLLALSIVWVFQFRARSEQRLAEQRAADAHELARQTALTAEVEQGRAALLAGDMSGAQQHLGAAWNAGDHSEPTAFMLARALQPVRAELARLPGSGRMWSATWSPDGTRIVTTDDRGAQVWSGETYQPLATLGHGDAVYSAVYRSATEVVTACGDGSVRIWRAETGSLVRELRLRGKAPKWYALAVAGERIAAVDTRGAIAAVWDAGTGVVLAEVGLGGDGWPSIAFDPTGRWLAVSGGGAVQILGAPDWHTTSTLDAARVHALAWEDNNRLLTGSVSGEASLWKVPSGSLVRRLREVGDAVDAVAPSPDGKQAALAERDGTEQVFGVATGQLASSVNHVHGKVTSIEFSPDGRALVATASSGRVAISDATTGTRIGMFDAPHGAARTARFSPDSRRVIGATWDGLAWVWSAVAPYQRYTAPEQAEICGLIGGAVPDGRYQAVSCVGHPTRVWDTARDRLLAELPAIEDGDRVPYPVVSEDGDRVAIAHGAAAEVYELPGGRLVRSVRHEAAVTALAFSGDELVSASADGVVLATRGEGSVTIAGSGAQVDALVVLPSGLIAAADASAHVRVLGDTGRTFSVTARARMLRASPDGRHLLAVPSYTDGTSSPTLIDLGHGSAVQVDSGSKVYSARWTSAGILTAHADGSARIWSDDGRLLAIMQGERSFLADATLSGAHVIGAAGDGALRFWDASTGARIWELSAPNMRIIGISSGPWGIVARGSGGGMSRWVIPDPPHDRRP